MFCCRAVRVWSFIGSADYIHYVRPMVSVDRTGSVEMSYHQHLVTVDNSN